MTSDSDQIEKLKRLVVFGSPIARAAALTLLDEAMDGRLLDEIQKMNRDGNTDKNYYKQEVFKHSQL
ncbi:MAG: hypothetical protein H0Z28_06450 [Archaeoglobus sp.]|nr:hypothetical protein [Archaeoglobus sp.]